LPPIYDDPDYDVKVFLIDPISMTKLELIEKIALVFALGCAKLEKTITINFKNTFTI
jgi:hypothetical protein